MDENGGRAVLARVVERRTPTAPRRWRLHVATGQVPASSDRLEAAVDCLLDNAVKSTDPGDTIAVTATITDPEWTIEVADSGTGLTPRTPPR